MSDRGRELGPVEGTAAGFPAEVVALVVAITPRYRAAVLLAM
jgi:hypothetical protein